MVWEGRPHSKPSTECHVLLAKWKLPRTQKVWFFFQVPWYICCFHMSSHVFTSLRNGAREKQDEARDVPWRLPGPPGSARLDCHDVGQGGQMTGSWICWMMCVWEHCSGWAREAKSWKVASLCKDPCDVVIWKYMKIRIESLVDVPKDCEQQHSIED